LKQELPEPMELESALESASEDRRQGLPDIREDQAERRTGIDRRIGWDRRRGPGRRRTDDRRDAEEGEMNPDQFEFVMAVEQYKKANKKPFPTYTELLEIAKALGYRKVAEPLSINEVGRE
jgi:hypothetical protein